MKIIKNYDGASIDIIHNDTKNNKVVYVLVVVLVLILVYISVKFFTGFAIFNKATDIVKDAKEQGIKIPEDLSLAGFDDLMYSSILDTKLTTVKQPIEQIAKESCEMMIRLINNIEGETKVRLNTELIVRNSIKEV